MGIRVHKTLGYGLTDLSCEGHKITDERINPDGILNSNRWEDTDWTREAYQEYLEKIENSPQDELSNHFSLDASLDIYSLNEGLKSWQPTSSVIHSPEFGLSNVLCIVPPCMHKDWNRYDDSIDYVEETMVYQEVNRVVTFKKGFFPWNDIYVDSRTGKRLRCDNHDRYCYLKRYLKATKDHSTKTRVRNLIQKEIEEMGFKDQQELNKFIIPAIPTSIRLFCNFTRIFQDEKTVFSLRPMLYVHWS